MDNVNQYSIKYPRRVLIRKSMIALGKVLLTLLADVEINGKEKLPSCGPIILAGNHAAVLEAVMMAVYSPGIVEFIGNGDIPFDPNYAFIANAYGLVPVNRGNLDRKGLTMGLDVLAQNGILGIFPEGGNWDPAQMEAQTGVAWLSFRANAPIIPIGFGGIRGGLQKAFRFKNPKLSMNIGERIPPVTLADNAMSMKANLEQSAQKILTEIKALVPDEDLKLFRRCVDESFKLKINAFTHHASIDIPKEMEVEHGWAYARFLFNPTMMDVLVRNLKLPLTPIKKVERQFDLSPLIKAWDAVLDYLNINPGYFTYRFGVEDGLAVKEALIELKNLGQWASDEGYALTIHPVRHFRNANTGALVTERSGCFPPSL